MAKVAGLLVVAALADDSAGICKAPANYDASAEYAPGAATEQTLGWVAALGE